MANLEIYKASAGSGKTYTLTRKYLSYLFNQATTHRNILAVTFTNKATEEMKVRILKELYLISINSEKADHIDFFCKKLNVTPEVLSKKAQEILKDLLNEYSAFQISTIDKFFLKIIQAFTHEMSLNGNYNLELDTDALLEKAIENMLNNLEIAENKELLEWLKIYAEELINNEKSWNPVSSISELGRELFKESFKNQLSDSDWHNTIDKKEELKKIQKEIKGIKSNFEKKIDDLVDKIKNTLEENHLEVKDFPYANSGFMANAIYIKNKNYEIGSRLNVAIDATEANEWCSKSIKEPKRQNINTAFRSLKNLLQDLKKCIEEDISQYKTACEINKNIYTIGILNDVEKEVNNIVKSDHLLLLSNANEFLSEIIAQSDTPFIYEKIGTRMKHFMIDEFQDTSGLQWNNFRPLLIESLSNNNENMLVGDVKQSIYRWRNSDWDLLNTRLKTGEENKNIKKYIAEKELETNYRSSRNVILFNNTFFTLAAREIKKQFQELEGSDNQIFTEKIELAYSNLSQKVGKENLPDGCVNVQFIEKSDDLSWQDIALQKMTDKVASLLENGNSLSDIAVLVRTNDEASCVAEYLLQNNYNVLSNEALKLKNAKSVQFIIAMFTYFVHPNDLPNRLFLLYRYFLLIKESEQPLQDAVNNMSGDIETLLFDEVEPKYFDALKKGSLFEKTEVLIDCFGLVEKCKTEVAFLQALQDVVFEYENKKGSDLSSFLLYWAETKKLNLNVPKSSKAIQILTIHASKGLEFKNVIIPFFDWKLEPKTNSRIWCGTKDIQDPFNKLPIVPMSYNSAMSKSLFKKDYLKEKMLSYIDTLNVAYVAFTRAREGLFVFAPKSKEKKSLTNNNLSEIIENVLQNAEKPNIDSQKSKFFISMKDDMAEYDDNLFVLGKLTNQNKDDLEQSDKLQIKLTYVPNKRSKNTLVVGKEEKWIIGENSHSARVDGLIMHNLMSKIKTLDDIDVSIQMFENDGQITKEEALILKDKIITFIKKHKIESWFSPDYKVLNEVEILQNGKSYRPDRVLIKDNHSIVIDYKFGKKADDYQKQVKNYLDTIEQMGYTTEGYLCYIRQDIIERV